MLLKGAEGTASIREEDLEAPKQGRASQSQGLHLLLLRLKAGAIPRQLVDSSARSCSVPACLELFDHDHGRSLTAMSPAAGVCAALIRD